VSPDVLRTSRGGCENICMHTVSDGVYEGELSLEVRRLSLEVRRGEHDKERESGRGRERKRQSEIERERQTEMDASFPQELQPAPLERGAPPL